MQTTTIPSTIETANHAPAQAIHWPSVIQFGFSALAAFILWGMALSTWLIGVSQRFVAPAAGPGDLQIFMAAAALAFCGLLLVPSAWYSASRLLGHRATASPGIFKRLRPTLLIFAFPVLVAIGYWISLNDGISWLLLPPVHVLAVSLPILWLAYLGIRDLPTGSPQRGWGVFDSGLALAPLLIMIAEIAALIGGLLIVIVIIALRPELAETITSLAERLSAAQPSPEIILNILQPVLSSPAVIFSVVVFGAVIVPLIEETIKPVGVWLQAGRTISPAEGFAAGVLSGAGYALVESLFLASSGEEWVFLVFARIGTSTMHILTAGLVGWALAQAWSEKGRSGRYLRLGATFLLAVLLHGLWNGLTMTNVFSNMLASQQPGSGWFIQTGQIAPYALGVLAVAAFATLLLANRAMRQTHAQEGEGI